MAVRFKLIVRIYGTMIQKDGNEYPKIRTKADLQSFQGELRSAGKSREAYLSVVLRWSYNDPDLFNTMVLGRGAYWNKQREMCQSVAENTTTLVLSGNQIGKSYLLSGILLWYAFTRPYSRIVSTAPTAKHLSRVLWTEIRTAHSHALYPLGGKIISSPFEQLMLDDKWDAIGITSPKKEALSGVHGRHVMVCIDEASGLSPDAWEGLNSLGYDKLVAVGNPVRTDNHFYNLCQKSSLSDSRIKLLTVSSLESPHIDQWKSDWGIACRSWLEDMKEQYGEGSSWWRSHVLALWPDEHISTLFRKDWLDAAVAAVPVPGGPTRIAVDYAEGGGGDLAVIAAKDDNNLLHLDGSNQWEPEELARQTALVAKRFSVHPTRISWDATGTGSAFGHFLEGAGIVGCRPYKGSFGAHANAVGMRLRDCAAWSASRRLDPSREVVIAAPEKAYSGPRIFYQGPDQETLRVKQTPFSIPEKMMNKLRPELSGLRYEETSSGKIKLENGEDFRERLGRSPNYADAFCQLWAYSD
jgi:hypothetical protein